MQARLAWRAGAALLLSCVIWAAHADPAPARCRYVKLASLPVALDRDRLMTTGGINGETVPVQIDTGAHKTSLFRWVADRMSLPLIHSNQSALGAGGESAVYIAAVRQFSLGPLHARDLRLAVTWDAAQDSAVAALIGSDVLMQADLEIAVQEGQIRFFRPLDCDDAFLAYWSTQAVAVAFETASERDLRPLVTVQLNGQAVRALIDTGAPVSIIGLEAAARAGVTPATPAVVAAGPVGGVGRHGFPTWIAPFTEFALGPEVSKNVHIRIGNFWAGVQADVQKMATSAWIGEQPEMILGMDFLKHHRLLLSHAQHRLYFTYQGGIVFSAPPPAP